MSSLPHCVTGLVHSTGAADSAALAATPAIALQRQCLAAFMDAHPQQFAAPAQAGSWAHYVSSERTAQAAERRTIDEALGMVTSAMRSAYLNVDNPLSLASLFERARELGGGEVEPDPEALAMALRGDGDPDEAMAYARAITVYRQCVARGVLSGEELSSSLASAFDSLPAMTPLMRAATETAKRLAQIDIETLLAKQPDHAHH